MENNNQKLSVPPAEQLLQPKLTLAGREGHLERRRMLEYLALIFSLTGLVFLVYILVLAFTAHRAAFNLSPNSADYLSQLAIADKVWAAVTNHIFRLFLFDAIINFIALLLFSRAVSNYFEKIIYSRLMVLFSSIYCLALGLQFYSIARSDVPGVDGWGMLAFFSLPIVTIYYLFSLTLLLRAKFKPITIKPSYLIILCMLIFCLIALTGLFSEQKLVANFELLRFD
jgi:hypothetical protein